MTYKHYDITVTGLVQGVFFRKHTEDTARKLGLKGFVMNKPDQSVYIEVEGNEKELDQFIAWCYEGSPSSKVKSVDAVENEIKGFKDFAITH